MIMKQGLFALTLTLVMIFTQPSNVHPASESEVTIKENTSGPLDTEEADQQEMPAKPVRTGFGFEKLPDGKDQPWRLVRGLQLLQDDIVLGKPRAEDAYKLLIQHLAKVMGSLDNSVWDHERNLDALATYIILGGDTELGYKALQKTHLDKLQTQPLEAAIAYAERDIELAYELMTELDHRALPKSMSAHFALARSMVVSATDLELASTYLNEARRIAPGTLVEEAALRRLIRISGEKKEFEDFHFLSRNYLRRFRKSYYFSDFLTNFSFALVRMPKDREAELLELLQQVVTEISVTQQITVASYVARHSTISGKKDLAYWTSNMALEKLSDGSATHRRMQLYSAAISVVDEDRVQSALTSLESLPASKFDQIDNQILESAKLLGTQILQDSSETDLSELEPAPGPDAMPENANRNDADPADKFASIVNENSVLKRAGEILSQSEIVLEGTAQ